MQFDFGKNWKEFSINALTEEKVEQARTAFSELVDVDVTGKTFIDIGFGQGLSLLLATERNAVTVGCDINPTCEEVLDANKSRFFPALAGRHVPCVVGSILDRSVVDELQKQTPTGTYDIVHSWGVLHHTGDMTTAIKHAASLVSTDGLFVLALYNRHWTSSTWLLIKWLYCKAPEFLQRAFIAVLYPVIWLAKFIVTGKNPMRQQRGMDFMYNVIDWVGGYPYEYESIAETTHRMKHLGFELVKAISAEVPTGCNEFVFRRTA
ncbi:MAG: class I SAM-dependent methyltransferase [Candidatus Kapabacteria bacterium]|nr:class I SAM-dependent methyltransferase [Candidatus Kapabacteria bacterium]